MLWNHAIWGEPYKIHPQLYTLGMGQNLKSLSLIYYI